MGSTSFHSNAVGLPAPISLAYVGPHEADLLAGRSLLPSQTYVPLFDGGARSVPGISQAIQRTLLAPEVGSDANLQERTRALRDLFSTMDQSDAMRAGDESRVGLVLCLMESLEEVKQMYKKVATARSRLLGHGHGYVGGFDVSESGALKPATTLTQEVRVLWEISEYELGPYWESMEERLAQWDRRDGTQLVKTLRYFRRFVTPRKTDYWGLGLRPSAATAAKDHETTLKTVFAFKWLIKHAPKSEEGASPEDIWRSFIEDTGSQVADMELLTVERQKALKKARQVEAAMILPA
eukprot:2135805-Rhodomonas_salina.1